MRFKEIYTAGRDPRGQLNPTAIVLHRTYGGWTGSYYTGLGDGEGSQFIGFHFLVGKKDGNIVQFYDTTVKCNHAAGANSWAVGIEFEGVNEDPLTEHQLSWGARIISAVCAAHNIPPTYTNSGPRRRIYGCLPHALVPGSNHTDRITDADWERLAARITAVEIKRPINKPAEQPDQPPVEDDEMEKYWRGTPSLRTARCTNDVAHVYTADEWQLKKFLEPSVVPTDVPDNVFDLILSERSKA